MNKISRLYLLALALCVGIASLEAQISRLGLRWALSHASAWGAGLPVVTLVEPFGPAQVAGLCVGDLIETIDGVPTRDLTEGQITELLHSPRAQHLLQVLGVGGKSRQVLLRPVVRPQGSMGERELAELLAGYSPEDASLVALPYPMSYTQSETVDLTRQRTFAFASSAPETADLDSLLNDELRHLLEAKGLREDTARPDLLISTFYQLEPIAPGAAAEGPTTTTYRYDPEARALRPLPVSAVAAQDTQYRIVLGVQIYRPGARTLVWSCEATDYLSRAMTILEYAHYMLEPMLSGFPLPARLVRPTLEVHTLRYLYTGLVYDRYRLGHVVAVEDGSPAFGAGLRPGDIIRSINGIPLPTSAEEALESYQRFGERTARYRVPLGLSDRQGKPLTTWQTSSYADLAEVFTRPRTGAALAYVFGFRPYVQPQRHPLAIEVVRGRDVYTVRVEPQLRDETTIRPY